MDVIQDENTEDIKKMAAIIPSDEDYMKTSVWSLVAHRLPWLMLLMISATFTSTIITHFETLLSGAVLLACQSYAAGYSAASASYSTPPSSLCISCKNRSLTQSVTSWRLRKFCFKSTRTQLPSSF